MSDFDTIEKHEGEPPRIDEVYAVQGMFFQDVQEKSRMASWVVECCPQAGEKKYINLVLPAELLGDFAANFLRIKGNWERKNK